MEAQNFGVVALGKQDLLLQTSVKWCSYAGVFEAAGSLAAQLSEVSTLELVGTCSPRIQ